jgi:hypothetical protein
MKVNKIIALRLMLSMIIIVGFLVAVKSLVQATLQDFPVGILIVKGVSKARNKKLVQD